MIRSEPLASHTARPSCALTFARRGRRAGFTLLEIVIAITILATVLALSYTILSKILETELEVSKLSTPEKIGNGILAAIRRDLMSAIYQDLGPDVFLGVNVGQDETANDTVSFFTTVPPINPDTLGGQFDEFNNPDVGGGHQELFFTGVTAVTYFMKETDYATERGVYTLFRRESIDFSENGSPFDTGGTSYELYDKMVAIDIEYFDGYDWFFEWFSEERLVAEYDLRQEEAELALEANSPVGGITSGSRDTANQDKERENTGRSRINARTNEVEDVEAQFAAKEEFYNALRPPVAIPVAVRVQITFMAGDEKGVYEEKKAVANPDLQTFKFSTVVPLLTGMRVPLLSEEDFLGESELDGFGEDGSEEGGSGTGTGTGTGTGNSGRRSESTGESRGRR